MYFEDPALTPPRTISSDHECGHTLTILPVGRALRRSLFPGSGYIEPGPPASILRCSLAVERRSKGPVVQCHHEQRLPC